MSNILLVDPNTINTNPNIINSVPQYQDMFIFAELTAARKSRSVIDINDGITTDESITVNFMGINQNKDDPNYLNYTTNYYDGSTGENTQYEGFGISSIKISINSSFIPQVSIQFIDIRGLAFFNQAKSPYRILFDFPPPLFTLKIKGYYGKSLEYKLHLVKYTSEFKAENGNYIIDADFVAVTFAPLTDVLLRYIINFPLMPTQDGTNISFTSDNNNKPKSTYELILKLKNLYDNIASKLKSLPDAQNYETILNQIKNLSETQTLLANYKEKLSINGEAYLILSDSTAIVENISIPTIGSTSTVEEKLSLITFSDFDKVIQSLTIPYLSTNQTKKLYIVYYSGNETKIPYLGVDTKNSNFTIAMDGYKIELLNSYKNIGLNSGSINISSVSIQNTFDVSTLLNDKNAPKRKYIGIDITDLYTKIYKGRYSLNQTKTDLANKVNTIINNTILEKLGMMPTIYNIFKIILDDVDIFFKTLNDISRKAEEHHNNATNKQTIVGSFPIPYADILPKTTNSKIYSFPLVIDTQPVSGGQKQIRVAPIKLSQKLSKQFPELELVENFIQTFNRQKQVNLIMNAKSELNDDATNKWIPISPLDSKLANEDLTNTYSGPYFGLDPVDGNGVNPNIDNKLIQALKIMLNRFYILSQSSYPTSFYNNDKNVSKAYVDYYAKSEAANLANSVFESKYSDNLKTNANKFSADIKEFYIYLSKNINSGYTFTSTNTTSVPLSNYIDVYVDKSNSHYVGSVVNNISIGIQEISSDKTSNKPVDKFQNQLQTGLIKKIFSGRAVQSFYNFTNENLIYIQDNYVKDGKVVDSETEPDANNINVKTRYVNYGAVTSVDNVKFINGVEIISPTNVTKIGNIVITKDIIPKLLASGNSYFITTKLGTVKANASNLKNFDSIVNPWIYQLAKHDTEIYNTIINTATVYRNLSALMFLSNFGYTLSPFNKYPNNLNSLLYNIAGVMQVPSFLPAYIGALVTAISGSDTNFTEQTIIDFFSTGDGKNLTSSGIFIFADIHDIKNYLSTTDKETYKSEFDLFMSNNYNNILDNVNDMYHKVETTRDVTKNIISEKIRLYTLYLNPKPADKSNNDGLYYPTIISPLITRTNILNYNEISFSMNMGEIGYTSLKTSNETTNYKAVNDNFFKTFFNELRTNLDNKKEDIKKQETENNKLTGDEDIVTQTYYSFKNINDKWLTNPNQNSIGYPTNDENKSLINSFAFVDRAMNPIGDTIINAEILINMFDDPNISVFSALSQLLSQNGFEFFPLQNFMGYTADDWNKSFQINVNTNASAQAAFVCMLVGGSSSYPTGISNGFVDDSITDLNNITVTDFSTNPPINPQTKDITIPEGTNDYSQVNGNKNFPWARIHAFRVRFGEQNQSMFTDIKIDSKEYPETNESIQILARLAGDNKVQSPIPKGQNLYNLYENRAYKATITGLGNAMIQPTQYFQLENIPIFNGAYIILTVEHDIVPNKMTTSFSGTKILKYPVPRVLNAAAIMGFEGGSTSSTGIYNDTIITTLTNIGNPDVLPKNTPLVNNIEQISAPIDPRKVRLTSRYGEAREAHAHAGIDLTGIVGLEVWAVKAGKISIKKVDGSPSGGYGNYISIDHGNNIYTTYGHLLNWADLQVGDNVIAGQVIGWCGNTGHGTGAHLHFEYRVGADNTGSAINPEPYLQTSMSVLWKNNVT